MEPNDQPEIGDRYIIFKELWSPGRYRCITITPDEVTIIGRGKSGTRPGPGRDGFDALIEQLRELGVFEWEPTYIDDTVIDGYMWEVEVRGSIHFKSFGANSDPGSLPRKLFIGFIR